MMMMRCLAAVLLSFAIACSKGGSAEPEPGPIKMDSVSIYACGDDRVMELRFNAQAGAAKTVWEWKVAQTVGLPSSYYTQFQSVDECKPSDNGEQILITSSSLGAVLLLEKKTKKALFYAKAPNAHSAEFLPGNYLAVATSTASGGNSLSIYHPDQPGKLIFNTALYSGHGVVWLEARQRLYALGFNELREYSLKDWGTADPKLQQENMWHLPNDDGHELFRVSESKLLVTTSGNVWEFDITSAVFKVFDPLKGISKVKSVNYNESTGQLVYTRGETEWWTNNIYCSKPNKTINIAGVKLYKARFAKPTR